MQRLCRQTLNGLIINPANRALVRFCHNELQGAIYVVRGLCYYSAKSCVMVLLAS